MIELNIQHNRVLDLLKNQDLELKDIQFELNMSYKQMYRILKLLREPKLVIMYKKGFPSTTFYAIV